MKTAEKNQAREGVTVRRLSYRYQRTLRSSAEVRGVGFLTGAGVRLRFKPAAPSTGIVFVRTDLRPAVHIAARVEHVTGTHRKTTLGRAPAQVMLVEHVLAALAGLRIDNCQVEIDGPEPPGLDGSSRAFVDALLDAGCVIQPTRRPIWSVSQSVTVASPGATLSLHPTHGDELKISYLLNYGDRAPIAPQMHTVRLTPESFANELSACRTFLLESEAIELRRQGIGLRITAADLIVVGPRGPIDNRLRHANELARHKLLDIVGDLALLGVDLRGHLVAYRSGHPLNIELARALCQRLAPQVPRIWRCAA
ncbi:MAG: UDP-3-O-acyl-N-acetylglucosamine deacetylase [Gemmataceae bacterium]|nr:UDP-3-O-acyl-N-acetylglucosamine deacetylase [Gemmataceae bacterium]